MRGRSRNYRYGMDILPMMNWKEKNAQKERKRKDREGGVEIVDA